MSKANMDYLWAPKDEQGGFSGLTGPLSALRRSRRKQVDTQQG